MRLLCLFIVFLLWEGWAVHHLALSQLSFLSTAGTLQLHWLILCFLCISVCFVNISSFKFCLHRKPIIIPSLLSPQQTVVPVQLDHDDAQQHQDQQSTGAAGLTGTPLSSRDGSKPATSEWFAKSPKQNSKKGTKESFHRHPKHTFYNRNKLLLTVISFVTSHSSSNRWDHNSKHISLDQLTERTSHECGKHIYEVLYKAVVIAAGAFKILFF